MNGAVRVAWTVTENVIIPVAVYLLLHAIGWQPVWALVGAAATSVVVLAIGYLRTRELTTLGLMVLLRFALDIAVAVITGDPQLELAKDFAITGSIGLVAAVSLLWQRPLIARIRRDIAGRPAEFDDNWAREPSFRSLHRRMSAVWAVGLIGEGIAGVALVYSLPLTVAVVATSILSPGTLFSLIGWTQYRAHRWQVQHDLVNHSPDPSDVRNV
ncbi:VC0807 family protein [Antrihabitans cavernicola]|uniref:DUF3159 domain-containing protein n=1 Tax=Antrihabitans cavernicola TaxID=2495913 RepID=A0A5A7S124_9NOCA|nr:VC0807 family protein [Spelaeibacter cavernicola]KAA0016499.1 hypothetical protein FOY51_26170 [Spelaeibacter cavernicola]